jgi:hypothetical protein
MSTRTFTMTSGGQVLFHITQVQITPVQEVPVSKD